MKTLKDLPDFLKDLPHEVAEIGLHIYRQLLDMGRDRIPAAQAVMDSLGAIFEKQADGTWLRRTATDMSRTLHFRAQRADEAGLLWEAVLIAPGLSSSSPPFYWDEGVLEAALPLFTGLDVNVYELTADFFSHLRIPEPWPLEDIKRYLSGRKVGWVKRPWYEAGVGIKGEIQLLEGEGGKIADILRQGRSEGNPDVLGLSIDSKVRGIPIAVEGFDVIYPFEIKSVSSVDVVTYPAAGGRFIRALQGLTTTQSKEERIMNKEQLLAMIRELRPDLLEDVDTAAMSEEDAVKLARMAMTPPDTGAGSGGDPDNGPEGGDRRAAQDALTREDLDEAPAGLSGANGMRPPVDGRA